MDTLEVSVASQQVDLDILNVTAISQGQNILDLQATSNDLTDAIINLGMDLSDLEAQLGGKVILAKYLVLTLPQIKKKLTKKTNIFHYVLCLSICWISCCHGWKLNVQRRHSSSIRGCQIKYWKQVRRDSISLLKMLHIESGIAGYRLALGRLLQFLCMHAHNRKVRPTSLLRALEHTLFMGFYNDPVKNPATWPY